MTAPVDAYVQFLKSQFVPPDELNDGYCFTLDEPRTFAVRTKKDSKDGPSRYQAFIGGERFIPIDANRGMGASKLDAVVVFRIEDTGNTVSLPVALALDCLEGFKEVMNDIFYEFEKRTIKEARKKAEETEGAAYREAVLAANRNNPLFGSW